MRPQVLIRHLLPNEETVVCALVERVFKRFVAGGYSAAGVKAFLNFASAKAMQARFGPGQVLLAAECLGEICGMIEIRNSNHIALLFVELQGQGIARSLVAAAVQECLRANPDLRQMTVNASLYAEPVYAKLGFTPIGPIQSKNGITFVPMLYRVATGDRSERRAHVESV